jgi:hypothetical protein
MQDNYYILYGLEKKKKKEGKPSLKQLSEPFFLLLSVTCTPPTYGLKTSITIRSLPSYVFFFSLFISNTVFTGVDGCHSVTFIAHPYKRRLGKKYF